LFYQLDAPDPEFVSVSLWFHIPRSLLLIPLLGALPPVFLNGVQALGTANEFRAIGMNQLTKEQSVGFRVGRIARYGHSLAGFDGISRPSDVR